MNVIGLGNQFIGFNDPNVVITYAAIDSNRQATEGIFHQRCAVLNAVMQYDCNIFDKHGACIQFAVRATNFGTQATGFGVLNASCRFAESFRIGAYLDYQAFQGNPVGLNLGSGGTQQGYNNPTFGGYAGYSQPPAPPLPPSPPTPPLPPLPPLPPTPPLPPFPPVWPTPPK